jgi:hypothetical protein
MARSKPWEPPNAGRIKELWGQCVDDMLDVRRNYWLNSSYFHGDQWIGWNNATGTPDITPFSDRSEADTRTTVNKFKPRTLSLMARLLRTPLDFEPRPGGVDSGALRIARLEQQILRIKHHRDDWELTRRDELQFTILGGVAAVCMEPTWEFETEPVQDEDTGEWFKLPERPSIKLTALSPIEFGLEPGTRSAREARWWMKCTTLTPSQAKDRYKLDYEPSPDADAGASPMQRNLLATRTGHRSLNRSCLVYVYYERPCGKEAPGCVVHVVGGKVVEQSPWPFDFEDRLNLRPFVQTPMGGTWKGDTIANDARQLQKNYNRAYSSINAHIGKADNARLLVPLGSLQDGEDQLTGEAAEIVYYDATAGGQPTWMNAPTVPRWLREHIVALEMEMDDLFSTHAVSRGQAPGDRNSGLALSILAEKDETPLGLMAGDQQRGWQEIAELVLRTERYLLQRADAQFKQHGVDQEMEVSDVLFGHGEDDATEVQYRAQDLRENPVVHVPLDAVMPKSQVAVQDMMLRLAQQFPAMFEKMDSGTLANMLKVPNPHAFAVMSNPQATLAEWENGRMAVGADDTEVVIKPFHDHDVHLQHHNTLRLSAAYRDASPEVQAYIDMHCDAHTKLAAEQLMKQQQQQLQFQFAGPPPGGPDESMGAPPMPEQQGVPVP